MVVTKKDLYKTIINEYKDKRIKALKILDDKKNKLYNKIPQLKKIDELLYTTGLQLSKQILLSENNLSNLEEKIKELEQKMMDLNIEKGELLTKYGYSSDFLELKYECNICNDTGFINNKECKCFKKRLIEMAYENSNLNILLDYQSFDNFNFLYYSEEKDEEEGLSPRENIRNVFNKCQYFVRNFNTIDKNLFMYGPTGLGKTFLSSCIAKKLLDSGKIVFYQTAYNIFEILESYKFNKEPESNQLIKEQVKALYEVDLLIIDDLGTEFSSTFTNAAFFNILNTRILNKKKTIINTNLEMEDIVEKYSDRVISRILDKYIILKFFGEDIRKLKFYT